MNEYTRREEILWTFVAVAVLVPAVAVAIIRLVLLEGDLVPDQSAIQAAGQAEEQVDEFESCTTAAKSLTEEMPAFKSTVELAKKTAEKKTAEEKKKPRRKRKKVELKIPWSAAELVHNYAKEVAVCETQTHNAAGAREQAGPAWKAVAAAEQLTPPPQGNDKAETAAAKQLLELLGEAPLDELVDHVDSAFSQLQDAAVTAEQTAETAKVRQPIPNGLFPRAAAIAVGVGVALAALLISFFSVRSVSQRRAKTLFGLRRFANTPEAGLQAAAIVRLAAHHNGGEPGMVVGAAVGGLLAALVVPWLDKNQFVGDLFVAGSMGGLLFGLALQWLVRTVAGVKRWRERVKELGNLEKPTIPVALVLGGVTPGLEKHFLRYFEALPLADAAVVVQKLAAQAEEQILAAADAGGGQPAVAPWAAPG